VHPQKGQKWKGLLSSFPPRSSGSSSLSSATLRDLSHGAKFPRARERSRDTPAPFAVVAATRNFAAVSRRLFQRKGRGRGVDAVNSAAKGKRILQRTPPLSACRKGTGDGNRLLDGRQTMNESRPRLVSKHDGMRSTVAQLARSRGYTAAHPLAKD